MIPLDANRPVRLNCNSLELRRRYESLLGLCCHLERLPIGFGHCSFLIIRRDSNDGITAEN